MKSTFSFFIHFCIFLTPGLFGSLQIHSQSNSYFTLLDKQEKSDFNYSGIDSINYFFGKNDLLDNVFNPQAGNYIVYRFTRTSKGISKLNDSTIVTTELILLKVEPNTKIIMEAIYFPLEWRELPLSAVLMKSTPNIKLRKKTKIARLKLDNSKVNTGFLHFN
jgi:hypothetical protein